MEKVELTINTGFLHVSTNKAQQNAPDFFGTIDIDGREYKLAGWKKSVENTDENYVSLNLDLASNTQEENTALRAENLKKFKADRKKKKNTDVYVMIEGTGTMHAAKPEAKEDFFGTVLIDGNKKFIKGFSMTSKKGLPVVKLQVGDGKRTKEERAEISKAFI